MLHLRTLGSLDLSSADGSVDAILAQPKRALLLAYLAAAAPRGFKRRDTLVALFWPELDAERARGALRKSLHFLRAALGGVIITRGDEVGVDTTLLCCDALAFEDAITDRRFADAMNLYRGDFLPAVFAKDAQDVERWIFDQRARFIQQAAAAAWALADESAANGATEDAASWASRAMALTPDDESALRRQMQLLVATGDKSSALRAHEEFAARFAREYEGATLSAETISAYLAVKRARSLPVPETLPPQLSEPSTPSPALLPSAVNQNEPAAPVRTGGWMARRSALAAAFAVTCTVLAAISASLWQRGSAVAETSADLDVRNRIAVMPFTVRGERIEYLREGMVDLLSITLQDAGDITTVDPAALIGAYARVGSSDNEIVRARRIAQTFRAGHFVTGTVVNAQGRLEARLSLFLTNDQSTEPVLVASGSGGEQQLATIVDNLTRDLIARRVDPRTARLDRLAAKTTQSLSALKDYLRGARAMRTGHYDDATAAFRGALANDSGFALAYYGLSMALGWASNGADAQATVMAAKAVAHSAGLSPHDSLLLTAHLHSWRAATFEAEQEFRRLLAQFPSDVDARHELGDLIFHDGTKAGYAMSDAADAFSRVLAIPAMRISAITHLARIAAIRRDTAMLDSLSIMAASSGMAATNLREVTTLRAFLRGDAGERARILGAAEGLGDRDVWQMACEVANYAGAFREAESLALLLTSPVRNRDVRALGWATVAYLRIAAGRPGASAEAIAEAALLDAGMAAHARAVIAATSPYPVSDRELMSALRALESFTSDIAPIAGVWDPSLRGEGRLISKRSLASALRVRMHQRPVEERDVRFRNVNRATEIAVRATLDSTDVTTARAYLAELQEYWALSQGQPAVPLEGFVRLARARLLRITGKNDEAARWFGTFPRYNRDDYMLLAVAALERGRMQRAAGDTLGARNSFNEVAFLWRDAEPRMKARASEAFPAHR